MRRFRNYGLAMSAVETGMFRRQLSWCISFITSLPRRTFVKPSGMSLFEGIEFLFFPLWHAHEIIPGLDGDLMQESEVEVSAAISRPRLIAYTS